MSKFTIEVTHPTTVGTDVFHRRIGQIDTYLSLDVIARFNDVGSWSIRLLDETDQGDLLQPGNGVVIWYEGLTNMPVMSGPIRQIDRSWSDTDSGPGTITVSGVDHNTLFAEHICLPDPANGLTLPDSGGLNGNRQTVAWYGDNTPQSLERLIYSLAYYNFGAGNTAGRTIKGLTIPSPSSWPSATDYPRTTYQLRFEAVLEALRTRTDVSVDAGGNPVPVGWWWSWDRATETVKLETYRPFNDPTMGKSVRFSQEIGNLKSYSYSLIAPKADWFLLGLDQDTSDKPETQNLYIADQRAQDIDWHVSAEVYSEHTDVSLFKRDADGAIIIGTDSKPEPNTDAINTAIAADAANNGPIGSLSIEPIDSVGCQFGRDYWLGDLVTIVISGTEITDVLREVHLQEDVNGAVITPTIGTQDASQTPQLYSEIRKIWDAVNRSRRVKQGIKFG